MSLLCEQRCPGLWILGRRAGPSRSRPIVTSLDQAPDEAIVHILRQFVSLSPARATATVDARTESGAPLRAERAVAGLGPPGKGEFRSIDSSSVTAPAVPHSSQPSSFVPTPSSPAAPVPVVAGRVRHRHDRNPFGGAIGVGASVLAAAALAVIWQVYSAPAPAPARIDTVQVPSSPQKPRAGLGPDTRRVPRALQQSSTRTQASTSAPSPKSTITSAALPVDQPKADPNPYQRVESLLRQVQNFMGANSPGRAYRAANEALDLVVDLQSRPDLDASRLETLKTRAERASTAALKQCDSTADPNTIRTQCP